MNVRNLALGLAAAVILVAGPVSLARSRVTNHPAAVPPGPQTAAPTPADAPALPPDVLASGDLRIGYFKPSRADANELRHAAESLFGRILKVLENGQVIQMPNLFAFGTSLVIHETPENLARILEELKTLDQAYEAQARDRVETLDTYTYTPRYVPVGDLADGLQSFVRKVWVDNNTMQANLGVSDKQGRLLVRETEERLPEIRKAIEDLDRPAPQVRLTCLLLRGGEPSGEDLAALGGEHSIAAQPIPRELTENLAAIVPYDRFHLLGMASVQATVATHREISLLVQVECDQGCLLEMKPDAYDASSKTLSLGACHVTRMRRNEEGRFQEVEGILSTSLRLHAGEYTVLGATGDQPIFVALRMDPLED